MDPSVIATVTSEIWKVGGIVGVLLTAIVILVSIMGRFLFKLIDQLSKRLDEVQREKTEIMATHMKDNTSGLHAVKRSIDDMSATIGAETRVQTSKIETLANAIQANPAFRRLTPRGGTSV